MVACDVPSTTPANAAPAGEMPVIVASVASGGQQTATNLAQLGAQNASGIGSLLTQQGNARASGYVGQANAYNQGLGGLGDILKGIPGIVK